MGLINQHVKQINPINIAISKIKKEKPIIVSWLIEKVEKSKIKSASLVPRPKIEIGKRFTNPTMVIQMDMYKKEMLEIPMLLVKINA